MTLRSGRGGHPALWGLSLALLCACAGSKKVDKSALPGLGGGSLKGPHAVLVTAKGEIVVRLLAEEAPKTVKNFAELAAGTKEWTSPQSGARWTRPLYDGTLFFSVIPGFAIVGGDPLNTGEGGPGFSIEDEIKPGRSFDRPGLVAMASPAAGRAGSQFFITLGPAPWLDGKHTVFGEVVSGLDVAHALAAVPRVLSEPGTGKPLDRPIEPLVLEKVRIEER